MCVVCAWCTCVEGSGRQVQGPVAGCRGGVGRHVCVVQWVPFQGCMGRACGQWVFGSIWGVCHVPACVWCGRVVVLS